MSIKKRIMLQFAAIGTAVVISIPSQALPGGNYQQSCRHCTMRHDNLHCNCLKRNQKLKRDTILNNAHQCAFVQNDNGHLTCTEWKRPAHKKNHRKFWKNAGPIFMQSEANNRCPSVCGKHRWTGQWRTTQFGVQSTCECKK